MKIKKTMIMLLTTILIATIANTAYGVNTNKTNSTNSENVPDKYLGDGLADLKIEGAKLSPSFDTNKYEYSVKYIGEDTKLSIETTTTEPYYTVEITGNKNLEEGENLITILVSDPDKENVATYQLTVNKTLIDEEAIAKEEVAKKKGQQKKLAIIVSCIAGTIAILIILISIIKKIKNR